MNSSLRSRCSPRPRCALRSPGAERRMADADVIERLERVIRSRMSEQPDASYVARLLAGGEREMTAKIREEADELVAASARDETVHEAADLVFHVLVLLASRGIDFAAVR